VKKIENRPTFVKVMNECIVAQFFWTHCVYTSCVSVTRHYKHAGLLAFCHLNFSECDRRLFCSTTGA